jgi:hypothetical protein
VKDWKILRHSPPLGDGQRKFYNLSVDPAETVNLAATYPQIVKNMSDSYEKYYRSVNIIPPDMNLIPMEIFGSLPEISRETPEVYIIR